MSEENKSNEDEAAKVRARLIKLLESDDWNLSERARREGKEALRCLQDREPRELEMVEYVISLLKTDTALRCAPQGESGTGEIAWQMTDERNVFIKLQIREWRIGEEYAYIQSIHQSVHRKKT